MYRHSESTGAQSENPKNSPTYYIVSGGFDPIHEGHIEMIKAGAAASDGVILLLNHCQKVSTERMELPGHQKRDVQQISCEIHLVLLLEKLKKEKLSLA